MKNVEQIISQMNELAKQLSDRRQEILKLQASGFIRSFIDLTTVIDQMDCTREIMRGRAETLLNRPRETEKMLRKEHLKVINGGK